MDWVFQNALKEDVLHVERNSCVEIFLNPYESMNGRHRMWMQILSTAAANFGCSACIFQTRLNQILAEADISSSYVQPAVDETERPMFLASENLVIDNARSIYS